MNPGEAAGALRQAIQQEKENIKNQANARLPRAAIALLNAEREVLSGNKSPSPPGSPPGRISGDLRKAWTMSHQGGGMSMAVRIESGMYYSGYLEDGTKKMAARPFVDKIQEAALPEIVSIFSELQG